MKKLYRKSTVHPTTSVVSDQLLSFLPAAILALTAALSAGDKEVLAYLIYCSSASNNRKTTAQKAGEDHAPCFNCNCFRCYTTYWVRWDSSPNRQLIHEIIDAFEDSLLKDGKKEKGKRDRKGKGKSVRGGSNVTSSETKKSEAIISGLATKEDVSSSHKADVVAEDCGETSGGGGGGGHVEEDYEEEVEGGEKGSVRRFVSFLGERIWSVWG